MFQINNSKPGQTSLSIITLSCSTTSKNTEKGSFHPLQSSEQRDGLMRKRCRKSNQIREGNKNAGKAITVPVPSVPEA